MRRKYESADGPAKHFKTIIPLKPLDDRNIDDSTINSACSTVSDGGQNTDKDGETLPAVIPVVVSFKMDLK